MADRRPDISPYDWLVWGEGELEQALAGGTRRRDVLAYLGESEYALLAPLARAAADARRDPDRRVHLIPGIMGSQLGLRRGAGEPPDLLWVDPVDVQRGRLDELAVDNDAIVSLGAAPYSYLALKLRLEAAGFTVRWADYDWRRGIDVIGAQLAARINAEPGKRHSLVGHSLGGLIARAASATAGDLIDRIVTLGTPHGGSYAALQALRGSYVSVRRVVQLDPARSAESLTESVFARFPSLYHMLPRAAGGPDLRDAAQWPDSTPRPYAPLLAQVGALALPAPTGRLHCIVGTGFDTVTAVTREAGQFRYHITRDGDGTVPRAFATPAGHEAWYTTTLHGELSRDATVAAATIDLLLGGTTQALGRTPPAVAPDSRSITDDGLREACATKLDWATMSPADRHAWFELLNAPVAAGSVLIPGDMSAAPVAIVWFRQDLRLADNPALTAAVDSGAAILPVYVWSPEEEGGWAPGAASRWWLHRSLEQLGARLAERGAPLVIRRGPAFDALRDLAAESGATAVYWNRRYEPAAVAVENALRAALPAAGIAAHSFASALLLEPWALQTKTGGPYQVYTPYWRAFLAQVKVGALTGSPAVLPAPKRVPSSLPLDALALLSRIPWHASLAGHWQPGEAAARESLLAFSRSALADYATNRDRPDLAGTSRLSPHLHFGELSPRQVWTQIGKARERAGDSRDTWQQGRYVAELVWREYAAHVLHHVPTLPELPKQAPFDRLPWRNEAREFAAWCQGRTGIALVDAGLRELWQTGWMHNRVRMVAASLLVKNLLHRWQDGERWFWDTLVDADLASNALNWQWVAGTGPDAAPFFRIFNPDTQAEKFDPDGAYRRRWVPEAGTAAYPPPIVDLKASRQRALDAYQSLRAP